jgi:SAM-dependent methyltransferase
MPHCVLCNQTVSGWVPHPHIEHRSEFSKIMRVVGSDLSVYQCPNCGSNDRERHLWLFLGAAGIPKMLGAMRILHLAPERPLEALIAARNPVDYVRGDLNPTRPDHQRIDVESLPFEDNRFDLILCNHILEHVFDPMRALRELHRCLKPGATLVAQTPYSPLLRRTMEITETPAPEFARLFFGQDDHVRLFGADIGTYFQQAGFATGEPIPNDAVLPGVSATERGFNPREPFFAFSKATSAAAAQAKPE